MTLANKTGGKTRKRKLPPSFQENADRMKAKAAENKKGGTVKKKPAKKTSRKTK